MSEIFLCVHYATGCTQQRYILSLVRKKLCSWNPLCAKRHAVRLPCTALNPTHWIAAYSFCRHGAHKKISGKFADLNFPLQLNGFWNNRRKAEGLYISVGQERAQARRRNPTATLSELLILLLTSSVPTKSSHRPQKFYSSLQCNVLNVQWSALCECSSEVLCASVLVKCFVRVF
jgi:hypothetical protein